MITNRAKAIRFSRLTVWCYWAFASIVLRLVTALVLLPVALLVGQTTADLSCARIHSLATIYKVCCHLQSGM